MSEFSAMIKEAFVGLDSFDEMPGRADLDKAIRKYDRRERAVRWMTWAAVFFLTIVLAGVIVSWFTRGEKDLDAAVIHLGLFGFAMTGIGMIKLWLVVMQCQLTTLKELKRTQILLLEAGARS